MAPRGWLIVLEGIDGCGTTSQAARLSDSLRERGHQVRLTCEPTSGPVGTLIRQILQGEVPEEGSKRPREFDWLTMGLLFAADRLDHIRAQILPALRQGVIVISDRYDLSSIAYQSVTAPEGGDAVPWLRELNRHALRPDLTVVIDVSVELAEQRRGVRGAPEELFERREIQRRLAELYRRAEDLVPGDRLVHVPGKGRPEQVQERILRHVLDLLNEAG